MKLKSPIEGKFSDECFQLALIFTRGSLPGEIMKSTRLKLSEATNIHFCIKFKATEENITPQHVNTLKKTDQKARKEINWVKPYDNSIKRPTRCGF